MTHILNSPPPKQLQKSRGNKTKTPKIKFPFLDKTSTTALKFIVNNLHKFLMQTALCCDYYTTRKKKKKKQLLSPVVQKSVRSLKIVRPR